MLDYQKKTKNSIMGWIRKLATKISDALKLPMVIKQICIDNTMAQQHVKQVFRTL